MTTAALKIQKGIQVKLEALSLPRLNWKTIFICGVLFFIVCMVFYVFQINQLTKWSYSINDSQKKITKLSQENKELQLSFAENSFLGKVQAKAEALNFQKVTSVKYVQVMDSSFAKVDKSMAQ